jgi:hypothetical protein
MLSKPINPFQTGFYSSFEEQLNHHHPLYVLSHQINWQLFEESFQELYSAGMGAPAKPIRLMTAL